MIPRMKQPVLKVIIYKMAKNGKFLNLIAFLKIHRFIKSRYPYCFKTQRERVTVLIN